MKQVILAVETGGTKIQCALGTGNGNILHKSRIPVCPGQGVNGILNEVLSNVSVLRSQATAMNCEIVAMGIGFGGIVDSVQQKAMGSEQIDGWNGFPVKQYFEEKTGIPTRVFNDSNAAAWGEYILGGGKGTKNFFYTNIGSGIGGGLILEERLYDGQGYGAAEFGQTFIQHPDGACGLPGMKLEQYCSGWAIQERLRKRKLLPDSVLFELCGGKSTNITPKIWGQAIEAGDPEALHELDRVAFAFSVGLINVIHLFSPERIAIGGGISLIGEPLIGRIRKHCEKYVYGNCRGRYTIAGSELGEDIVPRGVLLLTGSHYAID